MNAIIQLSFWQVALAYVFVAMTLLIVRRRGIRREKDIFLSSVRMTLQLILAGFILVYVMDRPHPAVTLSIILLMEGFAIFTILRKFRKQLSPGLKRVTALSLSVGTLSCLAYYLFAVVGIAPWYDPRYFIPIAGMLIGNSMTGISLGLKSLTEGMSARKTLVEEALILGATPKAASKHILDHSFDNAIMPTMQSMAGMGIVFLPGMMTGQILSGTAPTTAIAYQIAIMLGILGAVSLSVILLVQLGYQTFFNKDGQLH